MAEEERLLNLTKSLDYYQKTTPICSFLQDRPLIIKQLRQDQPIYLIENLATVEECQHIIEIGTPSLQQSTVIEKDVKMVADYRTSWTGFLTGDGQEPSDPILNKIMQRISGLSGYPIEHFEGVNIVRYKTGQKYDAHHDFFGPEFNTGKAGQRIMTFFLYLNDVPEENGGDTYFPLLDLRIQPKAGSCAFWFNTSYDGTILYEKTKHSGQPIIGDAIKYANNFWIRRSCFCNC